ncbi:hypothetical protein Tco_0771817 [Tanacetum coccineum]|uniref:Uncharacterized protein n=1 Tax=Tanacetum coccineum TaxID=301880 RepID=A0ABQ4ZHG6_9ASTR
MEDDESLLAQVAPAPPTQPPPNIYDPIVHYGEEIPLRHPYRLPSPPPPPSPPPSPLSSSSPSSPSPPPVMMVQDDLVTSRMLPLKISYLPLLEFARSLLPAVGCEWCYDDDDGGVGVVVSVAVARVKESECRDRRDPLMGRIFGVGRRTRRKVIPAAGDGGDGGGRVAGNNGGGERVL